MPDSLTSCAVFSSETLACQAILRGEADGLGWILIAGPSGLVIRAREVTENALISDPEPCWGRVARLGSDRIPTAPVQLMRGDAAPLVTRGDDVVLGISADGALISPDTAGPPDTNAEQKLFRGDSLPLAVVGHEIVVGVAADGRVRLHLDAESLRRIAAEIALPGGRPASPDDVQDFDTWHVRRDGEFLYFDAIIWGQTPREYLRRGSGDPWVNGVIEVPLRLIYGDELTDAPVSKSADHFAHILSINDGFGQSGLNGAQPVTEPTDIQRVDRGFASLAADSALKHRRGPMPWIGVRNEGVMGADLDELTNGQGFDNLVTCQAAFDKALAAYGRRAAVDTVTLLLSGIGAAETATDYKAALLKLLESITRETGPRQINLFQPPGCAIDGRHASVLGTTAAFVERGAMPVVPVSPMYWCSRRPGSMLQPDRESMTMLAELDGLARPGWMAPLVFAAEADGRDLHLDFEVMPGHRLIKPSRGLSVKSINNVEITNVEVTPDPITGKLTRLSVALSDAPENGLVSYAYGNLPANADLSGEKWCSQGDLCDDWSLTSVTGKTLRRYAFSFEMKIQKGGFNG